MAVYRVKLYDKASGESRQSSVAADSKDEALWICEQQEFGHVGFWLPDSEVKDLEKKEKDGTLSGREKGRLYSHRQAKVYEVQKVEGPS